MMLIDPAGPQSSGAGACFGRVEGRLAWLVVFL